MKYTAIMIDLINKVISAGWGTYVWGLIGIATALMFASNGDYEVAATLGILSVQVIRQRRATAELLDALKNSKVEVKEPEFPEDKYPGIRG